MESMRPVLRRGRSVRELDLLPRDELEARLSAFRSLLSDETLEAAVVVGTVEDYAPLAYLTGYAPMHQWATVLVHHEREPVLLAGLGGARNLPYVRTLTWLSDLRWYPSIGEGAEAVFEEWRVAGRVGVVGASGLPITVSRALLADLAERGSVDLGDRFAALRRRKRPRELAMMRRAASLRDQALHAGERSLANTGNPAVAALDVEGAARMAGARDVRVLFYDETDATWRVPARSDRRGISCTLYLGVEVSGYWSESLTTLPWDNGENRLAAIRAVSAMTELAREGTRLGALAEAGLDALDEAAQAGALAIGLGSAVGLGRERPVEPGAGELLEVGEVLSLHCFVGSGARARAHAVDVLVTAEGPERFPSPPTGHA